MTLDLVLVGYGHVARRFVELIAEQKQALARDHGVTLRVVGITTRHHGQAVTASGVVSGSSYASTAAFIRAACTRHRAAARQGRLIVVETTTLDIAKGEPAISHVRAALAGGAHVVTANKGPAAFAYRALARAAARAKRRFLFEGAVMDGIPIFNLVRETLPALTVVGFRGVVNSTTNYILTAMEQGESFDAALARMQAAGHRGGGPIASTSTAGTRQPRPRRWPTCCWMRGSPRTRSRARASHAMTAPARSRRATPDAASSWW